MSYIPRDDMIDRLEVLCQTTFVSPDTIHELDLAAIYTLVEEFTEMIEALEGDMMDGTLREERAVLRQKGAS
jgi:hypothetical protein